MAKMVVTIGSALIACIAQAQYTVEILHYARWPQSGCFGANSGQQVGLAGNYFFRAILWRGAGEPHVDLHNQSWYGSVALATDGTRQVGHRTIGVPGVQRVYATIWSGTAQSWVNLNPPGNEISVAHGIAGDVQVGFVKPLSSQSFTYAVLWRNTAESMVWLHPPGTDHSEAFATDGNQHVGYVYDSYEHKAALWEGTGARYIRLHPLGYGSSEAHGVANGQQVGYAALDGSGHAALWYGSTASFVDLNPDSVDQNWGSRAYATNGSVQVGMAGSWPAGVHVHAAAWRGSSESYVNLHQFLPSDYQGYLVGAHSEARGIDAQGVIVGWARHLPTNTNHAVIWRPIRR